MLPRITQDATKMMLPEDQRDDPMWPTYSESVLTPMFEDILDKGNLKRKSS